MFFFRVDPMFLADTKHVSVLQLTGIHTVTGLTASGLIDCIFLHILIVKLLRERNINFETAIGQTADRQTGFWLSPSSRKQSTRAQRQITL